ncbi:hypothetical protein U1Q18_021905, partial [Sarracenia purpurea var. burkii]
MDCNETNKYWFAWRVACICSFQESFGNADGAMLRPVLFSPFVGILDGSSKLKLASIRNFSSA